MPAADAYVSMRPKSSLELLVLVQVALVRSSSGCTVLLQVGDSLTLADSNMALTLLEAFRSLIGQQEQRQLHSVMRWLASCMEHPALAGAAGSSAALLRSLLRPAISATGTLGRYMAADRGLQPMALPPARLLLLVCRHLKFPTYGQREL